VRFAVVVGNDQGDPADGPLRYAEADAARVASVLQEVGGVRPENLILLRGQDAEAARRTLIAVNDRVRASGGSSILLVYYSGHADAAALHLGPSRLDLAELEQLVRGSAAAFRLLVLDSCRSGALTRVKGGAPIVPFAIELTERVAGEGAVFLTSSSASEDSQESDELKGSFFTHALLSGLLGAADENGDGRITLDEAYRHAYEATLRASSRTRAGPQHPTFQYEVRGQGDLVLATLEPASRTRAWLELPPRRSWLLLQGSEEGPVVAEVGAADRARRLSVRPGRYFLRGRGADVLLEGALDALPGLGQTIDETTLRRTAYARLLRKGGGEARSQLSLELEGRVRSALRGDAGFCPGLAIGLPLVLRSATLTPRVGWCRTGFSGPGLAGRVDELDLELAAAHAWDLPGVTLELGLAVGASVLRQSFRTAGAAPARTSAALQLAPFAAASLDLGPRSYLFASLGAGTWLSRLQDSATGAVAFSPSFALRAALGAGLRI
jgi:hypothetical protein